MNQLRELQAQLGALWARLTVRERRLVSIAAAAVAAFVVFLVLFGFSQSADGIRSRMDLKLQKLEQVQLLAQDFNQAQESRRTVERQLSSSNVQLISYLEEKGEKAGLDIRSMNPKADAPVGDDGSIIESSVEVNLTDVQLDKLVAFLSDVERGPGIVKVKRIRMEPRVESKTITAWTTISTYSLKR